MTDVRDAGDLCERFAVIAAHAGFPLLMRSEIRRAAEFYAICLGAFAAFGGARSDEVALEFS